MEKKILTALKIESPFKCLEDVKLVDVHKKKVQKEAEVEEEKQQQI